MSTTQAVADRLYELCTKGQYHEAMLELYADDAEHHEAMVMPGSPYKQITKGKAELLKMSEHWAKTTKVYGGSLSKPLVNGDTFLCEMSIDCEHTEGPMAGQRMNMTEHCLYTVRSGKISEARFFYGC